MAVIQQKQGTPCFWKNKKNTNTKNFCIKFWSMQMLHCKQWHTLHGSNMICEKILCTIFPETMHPLFLLNYGHTLPWYLFGYMMWWCHTLESIRWSRTYHLTETTPWIAAYLNGDFVARPCLPCKLILQHMAVTEMHIVKMDRKNIFQFPWKNTHDSII